MKKIFSFIVALCMMITLASAQTVESSRLFENTYVTVMGGGVTTTQYNGADGFWNGAWDVAKHVKPAASLEFGNYVTPVVGFSLEGVALFNTINTNTWVNQSNVVANAKFNLSNLFGGYKGQPRVFEVVLVPGLGWGHDYGYYGIDETGEKVYSSDPNYATYNAALELNFNLGKQRAWQINVKPVYTINHRNTKDVFVKDNMNGRLMVGVTYKFGSKRKGGAHNFVLCPYSVTKADYDAVVAERDALKNRPAEVKEVVKEVPVTKEVVKTEVKVLTGSTVITFPIGSCALSKVERQKVEMFAKSLDKESLVQIVGSADSKTGTETRNFALAQNRANVVKNVLTESGVAADRISVNTVMDATDNVETSRSAILTLSVE